MNISSDGKKCIICLALAILMGVLLIYTYMDDTRNDHQGIIRLHVIANSDTAGDQAVKLKVRDAVIAYMNKQDHLMDVEQTRDHLEDNLGRLEAIAAGIVASEGCDDPVKADIGVRYIPEKTYGDITFPAGSYEALSITIGNGEGENWWCVLFPPLCLLDEGTDAVDPASSDPADGESSDSGDAALSSTNQEERLHLRWKLLELLNEE